MLGGAALAACGGKSESPERPTETPDTSAPPDEHAGGAPETPPPDPSPQREAPSCPLKTRLGYLRPIDSWSPTFPSTLYSWTTAEQANELRSGAELLSRTVNAAGSPGHLFDVLAALAARGDGLAALLGGESFRKGRFGWNGLAGTRVGPETYGDEIVKIELKPEAVIAVLSSQQMYLHCLDRSGYVPNEQLLADPTRLGAILFTHDRGTTSLGTFGPRLCNWAPGDDRLYYREFYIGNPAMIASYELGTKAIREQLEGERATLESLADQAAGCPPYTGVVCDAVVNAWYTNRSGQVWTVLGCLAFSPPRVRGALASIDATFLRGLADDLARVPFVEDPFVRPLG